MAFVFSGVIIVLCFATCIVPTIIFYIGCISSYKLCGNKLGYFARDTAMNNGALYIYCIVPSCCIGISCFVSYLIFVIKVYKSISNSWISISFIYCLIFLIIPFGSLIIFWSLYWLYGIYNKEQEIDRQIQKELNKDNPYYGNPFEPYYEVLFMGNNMNCTSKIFTNIRIYCNNNNNDTENKQKSKQIYYNELLIKYIIKNLQSLIILTGKNKSHFNKLLKISTFGIQRENKGLNHKQIIENIFNVWNDIHIQNIFSKLKNEINATISININTEIKESDIDEQKYLLRDSDSESESEYKYNTQIHIEFINHFLIINSINIKQLYKQSYVWNINDINILLKEHSFYKNKKGYFGEYEYRVMCKHSNINIRLHESQTNDKWIYMLLECYDIQCVVYIVDLSLLKYGNSMYTNVIKYWYTKYIPLDVENLILKYVTNQCFINDIQRFHKIANHFRECIMVLLFVNGGTALEDLQINGIDKLKIFFPNQTFEQLNIYTLLDIKTFYSEIEYELYEPKIIIKVLEDVCNIGTCCQFRGRIGNLIEQWEDICTCMIQNSLRNCDVFEEFL